MALDASVHWRQAPAMVMAFLKPNEDGSPPELGKDARIALQHFPGPLKYPYMHQFLTAFAGMIGCAQPAACEGCITMLSASVHATLSKIRPIMMRNPLRLSLSLQACSEPCCLGAERKSKTGR